MSVTARRQVHRSVGCRGGAALKLSGKTRPAPASAERTASRQHYRISYCRSEPRDMFSSNHKQRCLNALIATKGHRAELGSRSKEQPGDEHAGSSSFTEGVLLKLETTLPSKEQALFPIVFDVFFFPLRIVPSPFCYVGLASLSLR